MSDGPKQVWYAFSSRWWATGGDEDGRGSHSYCTVDLEEWEVVRETAHTVLLARTVLFHTFTRRVYKHARRRWACPTVEKAVQEFKRRKHWAQVFAQRRIRRAQSELHCLDDTLRRLHRPDLIESKNASPTLCESLVL